MTKKTITENLTRVLLDNAPFALALLELTATFAPCNCDKTPAIPVVEFVSASTENGISAIFAEGGADEL